MVCRQQLNLTGKSKEECIQEVIGAIASTRPTCRYDVNVEDLFHLDREPLGALIALISTLAETLNGEKIRVDVNERGFTIETVRSSANL